MNLTPEQQEQGRRNFLKAAAGVPALAALAGAAALKGPKRGGPVKAALVGAGGEGRVLLGQCQKQWIDIRAICDINITHAQVAADGLEKKGLPKPRCYEDLKEMLEKEDLEAVLVATPLWAHAPVTTTCLEAGKHVLCEKMMAWDEAGCHQMAEAARKNNRLLEIGYQRFYNPTYHLAYDGFIKKGLLGDIYYIRTVWHRNSSWRRDEKAPSTPGFDPKKWGYEDWEHLVNWRLYKKHSRGLLAELGSHQVAVANWFYGGAPEAVFSSGHISRYKDGREVPDHVYSTFEYGGGRTATFTSVQSNAFDDNYEQIMGTKGTLILRSETDYGFWDEKEAKAITNVEVTKRTGNAIADASESRAADAAGRTVAAAGDGATKFDRLLAYRNEINAFCAAIRTGSPLNCGPEKAIGSATACIRAFEAGEQKNRLILSRA